MLLAHIILGLLNLSLSVYIFLKPSAKLTNLLHLGTVSTLGSGIVISLSSKLSLMNICLRLGAYLLIIGAAYYKIFTVRVAKEA